MIAHWFQRELGQIVAPDPELTKPDADGGGNGDVVDVDIVDVEDSDDLLQILAPDPIYLEKVRKHHHHQAQQPQEEGARANLPVEDTMVECIHCHKLTPSTRMAKTHRHDASPIPSSSVSGTAQYATPSSKSVPAPTNTNYEPATAGSGTYVFSPPPQQRQTIANANTSFASQQLDDLVLSAVKDTAKTLTSNESYWELTKNFFTWCASSEPLTLKQVKKLQKALKNEPELANARSVEMKFVPDGFTPLHAAALVGREEVARILIDFEVEDDVDNNYNEEQQQQQAQEKGEKSDFPEEMKQGEMKEPRPTMAGKENKDTDSVADQKKDIQDENESRKQATEQTRTHQDKDSTNNNNNNNNNNIASKNTKSKVKKTKKAVSLYTRDNQGRTPLHIAAERGHLHLVRLLLDAMTVESSSPPQSLKSNSNNDNNNDISFTSPDGKVIEIKQKGVPPLGKDAPVDLAGRTPLGWAVTSRNASARKNRVELEQVLFSPGDKSICGTYTPAKDRGGGTQRRRAWTTGGGKKSRSRRSVGSRSTRGGVDHNSGGVLQLHGILNEETMEDTNATAATRVTSTRSTSSSSPPPPQPPSSSTLLSSSMELTYGFSEMPGFRIEMEDAMCYHYPLLPPSCTDKWIALFGVFDGHGDGGLASQYVSRNIANALCSTAEYEHYVGGVNALAQGLIKACMEIDDDLKRMKFRKHGGTTAVLTIITEEVVIVGNLGDSRCILVQRPSVNNNSPNVSGVGNAKGKGQLVGGQDVPSLVDDLGKMTIEEKRNVGVRSKEKGDAGEKKTKEKETSAGEGIKNQEVMEVDGASQDKDGKTETETETEEEEEEISSGPEVASSPTPLEITTKAEHASVDLSDDGQVKQVSSMSSGGPTAASECGIIVTALSEDHKPNLPDERIRIEKAGMDVVPDVFRDTLSSSSGGTGGDDDNEEGTLTTIWKIRKSKADMIAVSRAFGDFDYKDNPNLKANEQAIVATPDIRIHVRDDEHDMFLVLACDGIWDVMSNDEVGAFVTNKFQEMLLASSTNNEFEETEKKSLEIIPTVCDELINECFRRGSRDNMSVLIVALPQAYAVDEKDDDSERDSYGHADDARRSLNFSDE